MTFQEWPKGLEASELNLLLLTLGLPVMGWIGRKLIRSVDSLNQTVARLQVVLLGTEDQGGLVRRVEGVAKQGHQHATDISVLRAQVENLEHDLEHKVDK